MTALNTPPPLCPAGRCRSVMEALAKGRTLEKTVEAQGEHLHAVLTGALRRLGVDPGDQAVTAALADEIRALLASDSSGSTGSAGG